jgi:hypothetical protein
LVANARHRRVDELRGLSGPQKEMAGLILEPLNGPVCHLKGLEGLDVFAASQTRLPWLAPDNEISAEHKQFAWAMKAREEYEN